MSPATVQLFFAILALVAMAGIAVVVVLRVAALGSQLARDAYDDLARAVEPIAVPAAWIVAALATAGSLYFSEVANYEPCLLCWYQRIAMYPLVVILAVGAVRRRSGGSALRRRPGRGRRPDRHVPRRPRVDPALDTGACAVGASCTYVWFRELGFISLPTLALTAFLSILALLAIRRPTSDPVEESPA